MTGFTDATLAFLTELRSNNTRDWFNANRKTYEREVRDAAKSFAAQLALLLEAETGRPQEPKIFRINRDLRFSKDKTPYNTHVHILFRPAGSAGNGPAWFFGLEPGRLTFGAGTMGFSPDQLQAWRTRVAGPDGAALEGLLSRLAARGIHLSEPELKRVPAPHGAEHPRAELLRRKSLTAWQNSDETAACLGPDGPAHALAGLVVFRDLVDWMTDAL